MPSFPRGRPGRSRGSPGGRTTAAARDQLVRLLKRRLEGAALPLRLAFWDGVAVDFAPSPVVAVTLRKPALLRQFLTGNIDRLGRSYVEGDLEVEGRIGDVIAVGIALSERIGRHPVLARLAGLPSRLGALGRRHDRRFDAEAIRYHYDVSNEFYGLWLDRRMVYSCAYFRTGEEDIDRAQEQKLDHICRKLRLAPGERLLDIGCGWGSLLLWAARHYGATGVGVTLSEPQCRYARERAAAEGLGGQVEIRLQDYRDVPGEGVFDKIASVGMYEHVDRRNLPLYFATIFRLLKEGGVVLNHGITTGDPEGGSRGPAGSGFIDRFVFPGGELPHISGVLHDMAGQGLEPLDVECLRPHYTQTLVRWVGRLEAEQERAVEIAGAARYRIWRAYMAGCAYAFDRGWLSVHQVAAVKPGAAGPGRRPWTRDHIYRPEDAALPAAPLRWPA